MTGTRALTKGSAVQATLTFLRGEGGEDLVHEILTRLRAPIRKRLLAAQPTDELAYDHIVALWRAADEVLGAEAPDWMERAGAHSIESLGAHLYGGILRKKSPVQFLTQSVSLFRLYYHPGDMAVVEVNENQAILRLTDFAPLDRLFCRRQTGGLRLAIELAGGKNASARHVRCALEGDAFCEWDLRWSS